MQKTKRPRSEYSLLGGSGGAHVTEFRILLVLVGIVAAVSLVILVAIIVMWTSTRSDVADVRSEYHRAKHMLDDGIEFAEQWDLVRRLETALRNSERMERAFKDMEDILRFMKDNQMLAKLLDLQNKIDVLMHWFASPAPVPSTVPPAPSVP